MGLAPRKFAGIETRIPGVYSKSNYITAPGDAGAVSNRVVVLGLCNGGIPYNATQFDELSRINTFTSIPEMQDILRGGPAYYMAEFYLTATTDPNLSNPSTVDVMRVNPATRATSKVRNSGDSADIIDVYSTRYGAIANQLAFRLQAGTTIGHRVIVQFQGNTIADRDNVALSYLSVQYTGAGSAATLTINATALTTTVTGGPGGEDLNLLFTDFATVGQLVAYIDAQPGYTATLLGSSDEPSSTLDAVTAVDVKTSPVTLNAIVEAVIRFLANETQGEITASITANAPRSALQNNASFKFLTGGGEGTATNTDWINALALLEKLDVNHILVASGDAAIHALVKTHCEQMSTIVGRKNRSAGAGASASTTTFDARASEMRALNTARFEYAVTPIKRRDVFANNAVVQFAPFYLSAMTAGIRFGNFITTAADLKTINVEGVGETYNRTDKERYINAGATLVEQEQRGFVVIANMTTIQLSNTILNRPSMLRNADFIDLDFARKLEARIASMDRAPTALMLADVQNWIVTNALPSYESEGLLTRDFNTGAPAFANVQISVVGDAIYVRFRGILPAPLLFGFVTKDFEVIGTRPGNTVPQ